MMWDSRVLEKVEVEYGMFSVSCLFKDVTDGLRWVFTGVYSPLLIVIRGSYGMSFPQWHSNGSFLSV